MFNVRLFDIGGMFDDAEVGCSIVNIHSEMNIVICKITIFADAVACKFFLECK